MFHVHTIIMCFFVLLTNTSHKCFVLQYINLDIKNERQTFLLEMTFDLVHETLYFLLQSSNNMYSKLSGNSIN